MGNNYTYVSPAFEAERLKTMTAFGDKISGRTRTSIRPPPSHPDPAGGNDVGELGGGAAHGLVAAQHDELDEAEIRQAMAVMNLGQARRDESFGNDGDAKSRERRRQSDNFADGPEIDWLTSRRA